MTTAAEAENTSTIGRLRIWIAIAAGAVTIAGGALAVSSAHGDLVHRLDRVEARVSEVESLGAKLDALKDDLADIKAELRLVRRFFAIPGSSDGAP